jgi:hypothetical protein
MGRNDTSHRDFDDPDAVRRNYFVQLSHRGRATRVLVALFLTLPGFVPIPYYGWLCGLPLFGPAAMLLIHAGGDRRSRRGVVYCSVPTVIGLALALLSLIVTSKYLWENGAIPIIFGITFLTTLLAAFFGRPPG